MTKITVRADGLITIAQAAEFCGVTTVTISQWIKRGILPVVRRERGRVLLNIIDVMRAEMSTRKRAARTPPEPPEWQLEDEPDADMTAVIAACAAQAATTTTPRGSVIYYVQFADRVKIGTTTNLRGRLPDIPHDRLLATEPGDIKLERQRHKQFSRWRLSGEWFAAAPELLAHAEALASRDPLTRTLRRIAHPR